MAIPKLIHYSDNSYVSSQGILLEAFESANDWNLGGSGASKQNDTIHKRQGSQSVKVTAVNGSYAYIYHSVNLDLSAMTNIIFWAYVHDLTKLDKIRVLLSTTTDFTKYFYKEIQHTPGDMFDASEFRSGWNRFVIPKSAFDNHGDAVWSDNILQIQFECHAESGEDVSVSWDDFRKDYDARAKCIITFDDGFESVYTKAKPRMDINGQAGVFFVITGVIGDSPYVSKTQLEVMRDARWDISNHTDGHDSLISLSQENMEAAVDDGYDWLIENGFTGGARFFCYPMGEYDGASITKVRERHTLARCTLIGNWQPHFDIRDDNIDMLIKCKGVGSTHAPATVNGWIDETIDTGGLLILMFHKIVDSGASGGTEYNKADFETISDYLKTKSDADDLDVITFSDYYDQFMPSDLTSVVYLKHGALVPFPIMHEPGESVSRTEDGRLKVYSHPLAGDKKRVWRFKCIIDNSGSSGYKWRDLEYFYWKVVEGAKRRCVFVDANSVQYLVRIIGFAPKAIGLNNRHEVTMILEEDYT